MMTRVKLMLLQEAILQEETMRKAGDWQQVKRIRYDPLEYIWQHNKTFKSNCILLQGEQAVDQGGHWTPQTGACPWQVGIFYKQIYEAYFT